MSLISRYNQLSNNKKTLLSTALNTVGTNFEKVASMGMTSGANQALSAVSDIVSAIPGPIGMIGGPVAKILGGGINALFGSKVNEENVNSVKSNIAAANTYNYASNFDALAENNMPAKLNFSKSFLGKDGLFSNKVSNMYKDLKAQAADAETFASNAFANNLNTLKTQQSQDASAVFTAAYGGPLNMKNKGVLSPFGNRFAWGGLPRSPLYNYGSNWTNGLSFINAGGTHESNPFEGIQVGIDPQGTPNLVEEGEVIWNDYVFSNRLKVPKAVRNKYKLGGIKPLTFAGAVKRLQKESEERPNDPISQLGLNDYMTKMAIAQEMKRAQLNKKGTNNMAAYGGKVNKFSGEEDLPYFEDPWNKPYIEDSWLALKDPIRTGNEPLAKPRNYIDYFRNLPVVVGNSNSYWNQNINTNTNTNTKTTNTKDGSEYGWNGSDWARLGVVGANLAGAAISGLKGVDKTIPNTILDLANSLRYPHYNPLDTYLKYVPVDRMSLLAPAQAMANATRRTISNTVGGNRGAALAAILGSDYNSALNLGKQYLAADDTNWGRYKEAKEFNKNTNLENSKLALETERLKQGYDSLKFNATSKWADLLNTAENARSAAVSANINAALSNIWNWITDRKNRQDVRWLADKGVFGNTGGYAPSTAKLGGLLNRRKKK